MYSETDPDSELYDGPSEKGVTNFDPDAITAGEIRQSLPLEWNFCRNPDGRNSGVAMKGGSNNIWCLTSDPRLRWDYCKPIRMYPIPRVCKTKPVTVREIDLSGVPVEMNLTSSKKFLVPYEEVPEEKSNCSQVHPDFNGTFSIICNEFDTQLYANQERCDDLIFDFHPDKVLNQHEVLEVSTQTNQQACRRACVIWYMNPRNEKCDGFQFQSKVQIFKIGSLTTPAPDGDGTDSSSSSSSDSGGSSSTSSDDETPDPLDLDQFEAVPTKINNCMIFKRLPTTHLQEKRNPLDEVITGMRNPLRDPIEWSFRIPVARGEAPEAQQSEGFPVGVLGLCVIGLVCLKQIKKNI